MLWLLVLLLPQMGCVGSTQNFLHPDNDHIDGVAVMKKRPQIYYCRSPNMEVFTCWWHPLDNSSESDGNVTYSLTYTVEKGPKRDCPDYVTGGPNSCHFDSSHTSIWTMYCMTVDARTSHGVFSSQEHCLDVADIVETEAPVDLTYTLMNSSEEEAGRTALVTWAYPNPTHIQYGWITLVFELQFRRVAEPNNWKVKRLLRETQLELLDMPVGEYVVRVRCRSRNQGIWSKWSASLLLTIPAKSTPGKPLTRLPVTISVTGVGVVVLLLIIFGIIPQGKRIKAFLLPPIPKPHIRGIDPLLLKKGSLDEINRHFISFHGYQPPSYSEEVWDSVSTDGNQPLQGLPGVLAARTEEYSLALPPSAIHGHPLVQTGPSLASFTPVPAFYCQAPVEDFSTAWAWPTTNLVQPELLAFPGTDYSMMVEPNQQATPLSSNQDFYTCVNVMGEGGEVHLVPCLSSHRKSSLQVQPDEELTDGGLEKSRQLFDYIANLTAANGRTPEETEVEKEGSEQCEVAVPLLPEITSTPGNRV